MQSSRRQNRQTLYVIIGVGALILLAICSGIFWYVNRQQNLDETVELVEVAAVPTEEPTATLPPTDTPTITPSPTPGPTATPTLPPTPQPLTVAVEGPEAVPQGLPSAVTWKVEVVGGTGAAVVSVSDLSGVLLTGDREGTLFLAKTIASEGTSSTAAAFSTEWVVPGVLDPNVGRGSITFLIETPTESESLTLPWRTESIEAIIQQSYTTAIDGHPPEELATTTEDTQQSADPAPEGFSSYTNRNNLQVIYPEEWFATEFQDGTLQVAADPIVGDGATPTDTSYLSIIAGDPFTVGIPDDVDQTAEAITSWLLGDFTLVGGEDGGVFISSELELLDQYEIETDNGDITVVTELIPTANISQLDFVAYIATSVREDQVFILSGFIPDGRDDFGTFRTIIESIEFIDP